MENFVVSARKYRPSRFDTVIGQEHVVQTLKNAIKNHHVAHAFLFCGPRGVGKTTSARLLAKTINCNNLTENIEACDNCDSCNAFNNNASFNIYELDAASNNSVDDIRGLVEQVRYAPQGARYKIYIIDEVHMLTTQAFNAFLKTLEEPPPYAKFILATTEKHKILPTILSRCQVFDFHRIKIEDAVKQLKSICQSENIVAEDEALHVIAQKADGAMRDALSIFDRIVSFSGSNITYNDVIGNLNILDYDYYFRATNLLLANDLAGTLVLFDDILNNGFDAQHFVSGFSEHIRNLMVCKHPDTLKLLEVSVNVAKKFSQQAESCNNAFLLNALNLLNICEINYKQSNNHRLHVELTLMKLANLSNVLNLRMQQQPIVDDKKKINVVTEKTTTLEKNIDNKVEVKINQPEKPVHIAYNQPNLGAAGKLEKLKQQISDKMLQQNNNNLEVNEPNELIVKNFTEDAFYDVWKEYINLLDNSTKTRVSSFLKEIKITFKPNFIINIELRNKLEAALLDEERTDMVPFFRKRLQNTSLDFEVTINENLVQKSKKLTKQEQLKVLTDKNPEIAKFVHTFGLEIDY